MTAYLPRVLPLGRRALLLEVDAAEDVLALADLLREPAQEHGWELVPAARTLLVRVPDAADLPPARALLPDLVPPNWSSTATSAGPLRGSRDADAPLTTIPVTYDGPDLQDVADRTGLAPDEVVAAHTGTEQRVAFVGFAPGFAYLIGGDPRLHVPRRSTPRSQVPPGSVGLAGEYSGIYPRSSPGGWQLIGRTDLTLWDVDRDPPALLAPGTRVRFEAT